MAVPEVSLLPRQLRVLPIAEQRIVDGRVFPLTLAPTNPDATMDELNGLVLANRELFLRLAMQHGAVLFRGFGSPSPEAFANFADGFRLKNFPYVGGAAPRTCVVRDVVFTTNESPPECPIPFHHEMAQGVCVCVCVVVVVVCVGSLHVGVCASAWVHVHMFVCPLSMVVGEASVHAVGWGGRVPKRVSLCVVSCLALITSFPSPPMCSCSANSTILHHVLRGCCAKGGR